MKQTIKFTNGWIAEYAHDGKWLLVDNTPDEIVQGVSYLDFLISKFNLVRVTA